MEPQVAAEQQGKGMRTGAGSLVPSPPPSKVNQAQAALLGKGWEPRPRVGDAATLLVGLSVEQQANKRGAQLPGPVVYVLRG